MGFMDKLFSRKEKTWPEVKKGTSNLHPNLEKYGSGNITLTEKEKNELQKEGRLVETEEAADKANEAIKETYFGPIREEGADRLGKSLEEAADQKKSV